MELKKVLSVLVNYGEEQLWCLKKVVATLKSFSKYDVHIVVQSNIQLNIKGIDEVNVVMLEDYQLLPMTCRKILWDNRDEFDLFIYGENDHLFEEHHLDLHKQYSDMLPSNRVPGLIQYEFNETGKYFPGYHLDFDWEYDTVEVYGDKVFAHFNNVHQATFIATQHQLKKAGKAFNFNIAVDERLNFGGKLERKVKKVLGLKITPTNSYSIKCKVNTDFYLYGGMKKVICISEFESNLIHHLPNLYIDGAKGRNKFRSDQERMNSAISKLLKSV